MHSISKFLWLFSICSKENHHKISSSTEWENQIGSHKPAAITIIRYSEFDSSIRRGGAPVVGEHKKDANRIDRIDLGWSRMFSPRLDDHHKDNRLWHSSLWFILLVFTPVGKLNSVIMLCHWQSYCGCGRMICKLSFETIIEYGNPSLALPPM